MESVSQTAPDKPKATPNRLAVAINVPVGHVLRMGEPVTVPFVVTVEAGIRWHPDWTEPRVTVAAYRFLPQGDAIGWTGQSVGDLPMPDAIKALLPFHGQPVTADSEAVTSALGINKPEAVEPLSAFAIKRADNVPITVQ